ncbi:hypothetical protein [Microvirga sp. VF16]|uniref:hypothetical protein n=1 Tax=Microvirga sp. VF16 TaxID=2807101 RepID=UPI00193D1349|nr:hypothetical protein [Microvirga sp. VF16]QRM34294.1 hypothetical protein JO965_34255 [Microvirga sp. VF16]
MPSDTLTLDHMAGHRTEYFSQEGEPWIRDTPDGHALEIRAHESLTMPIAAYIQHMRAHHSATPGQERTSGLVADSARARSPPGCDAPAPTGASLRRSSGSIVTLSE